MNDTKYTIGMDLGTDSARAVLYEAAGPQAGREISVCTCPYPRWSQGLYCDPSEARFRQHPLDYLESVETVLKGVIAECPDKDSIVAIAADTTGSTPCLIDGNLTPLCLKPGHEDDPDAMFILWKDHTGEAESQEINALLPRFEVNYADHSGKLYGPENFWSKMLHVLRRSPGLREDAYAAIELCDYVPAVLTGCRSVGELKMGHAVAQGKWMWSERWGGYPPEDFFNALDPVLVPFLRRLPKKNHPCQEAAGTLCPEWAEKLGLSERVFLGVGNIDSYSGALGAGAAPGKMIMNLGTSACFMNVVPDEVILGRIVPGVFGQVNGMILPGCDGFETGLSAYGDAFAWFKRLLGWPLEKFLPESERASAMDRMLSLLNEEAAKVVPDPDAPLATDHLNGRRTPYLNSALSASFSGLKLSTTAPELYYALVESTAFATRAIIDHMESHGVPVEELVAVGGVSRKSPFAMQMLADVTGRRIDVSAAMNAGTAGAALNGAVIAGLYPDVASAQKAICPPVMKSFEPDASKAGLFEKRYGRYIETVKFNER